MNIQVNPTVCGVHVHISASQSVSADEALRIAKALLLAGINAKGNERATRMLAFERFVVDVRAKLGLEPTPGDVP